MDMYVWGKKNLPWSSVAAALLEASLSLLYPTFSSSSSSSSSWTMASALFWQAIGMWRPQCVHVLLFIFIILIIVILLILAELQSLHLLLLSFHVLLCVWVFVLHRAPEGGFRCRNLTDKRKERQVKHRWFQWVYLCWRWIIHILVVLWLLTYLESLSSSGSVSRSLLSVLSGRPLAASELARDIFGRFSGRGVSWAVDFPNTQPTEICF